MIKKFTLLLLAMVAVVNMAKADQTEILYKTVWTGNKAISYNTGWVPGEQFYTDDNLFTGFTNNHSIKLNVNTWGSPEYALRYITTDSWLEPEGNEWSVSDGTLSYTPSAEEVDHIKARGLVLSGVNYKVTEIKIGTTSVWTGTKFISWNASVPGEQFQTSTVDAEMFKNLESGNTINVTVATYGDPTYQFKYRDSGWNAHEISSGVTVSDGVATIAVTDNDIATAIAARGLLITGQAYFVTKISYGEDITGTDVHTTETELDWNNNKYIDLCGNNKGELANAQVNDYIRVTYTTAASGSYALHIVGSDWEQFEGGSAATVTYSASEQTYDYQITSRSVLNSIRENGINVTGHDITSKSVKLLKPENRYDVVTVSIGESEIATWSHAYNLDFTDTGITPYYASAADEGVVTLTSTNTTWNYQGYILKGDEGTYYPKVIGDPEATFPSGNLLRGHVGEGPVYKSKYTGYTGESDTDNIKNKYRYIFAKHNGNIGFYLLDTDYSEGGNPYHTLAAHKAYLETKTNCTPVAGARGLLRLSFGGGEGTTAINTALKNPIVEDGVYYNLQGVAVKNPSKGIYILNGKKVFVK